MRNLVRFFVVVFVVLSMSSGFLWAGQNSGAGIRFDLNGAYGNQNQTQMACPGTNTYVRMDIYVVSASNLDTYEFDLNYNSSNLEFISAAEDQPVTYEGNFLKKNGGSTTGWGATDYGSYVNIRNSLTGDQGESTPDGEGLLASVVFKCLVDCPGNLTFGDVDWYDNATVKDVCTDKGIVTLPVQMTNFMATSNQESGTINLTWQAENEIGNVGYHVWRSENETKDYNKITASIIHGKPDNLSTSEYSFSDKNISHGVTYWYKIETISINGNSEFFGPVSAVGTFPLPDEFGLSQNYPNPFNPETTIEYQLPEDSRVTIRIYNLLGKQIRELINENKQAGYLSAVWDGKDFGKNDVSSGIYLIQMQAGKFHEVKKATILR